MSSFRRARERAWLAAWPIAATFAALALLTVHCGSNSASGDAPDASGTNDGSTGSDGGPGNDGSVDASTDAPGAFDGPRVPYDAGSPLRGSCPESFTELPGIPAEAVSAIDLATGDFNGDGKTDIAMLGSFVFGHGNAGLDVALGAGDGTFGAPSVVQTAPGDMMWEPNAGNMAVADLDGDGKADIVTSDPASDAVTVVRGGSDGGIGALTTFATGSSPMSVAIADVTGDGKLDAITANYGSGDLSVLAGDGKAGFAAPASIPVTGDAGAPLVVTTADFNGDHRPDVAVLAMVGTNAEMAIVLTAADAGAPAAPKTTSIGAATTFATLDVNHDGKADVAVANTSTNAVDLYVGVGDGTFATPASTALDGTPAGIAVTDVDGDTVPDVVVSCSTGVRVLKGGSGTLGAPTPVDLPTPAPFLAVGDVNGDGKPDLALAASGAPIEILVNQGGTFPPVPFTRYATGTLPDAVVLADLDGDGFTDLAVANGYGASVSVFLHQVGDTLTDGGTYVEASDAGPPANPNNAGPVSLAAVDVNRDGRLDLVVLDGNASHVNVLLNQGKGVFGPPASNSTGGTPTQLAQAMTTGDWNGDGLLDVAVADVFGADPSTQTAGNVAVLFGHGDGSFAPPSIVTVGNQPAALASADLEGQGVDSLVVATLTTVSVVTFDTHGQATADDVLAAPTGSSPGSIAVADFDGDGKADIAVSLTLQRQLDVLAGAGDGTFAAPVTTSLEGQFADQLTPVDVNGDGRIDLVAVDHSSGMEVFTNVGGGLFARPAFYAMGSGATAIAVASMDGPRALSFVTANAQAGDVSVLLGTPCPMK